MSEPERFSIIPCGENDAGLFVIWDRVKQEVIDVLTAEEVAAYGLDDGL